jgi:hypothetical protein
MIRKFILPLIAIVLLSSCANKFSLVKRKYNKGYYFDIGHKKSNDKTDNIASVKEKQVKPVIQEEPVASEVVASAPAAQAEIKTLPIVIQPEHKTTSSSKHMPVASAEKKKDYSKGTFRPVNIKSLKSQKKTGKGGSSDGELIIMIILCLFPFINLIPVYMHDGKDVTLNFWLTLILDLLFFLPGIIFALLVVLDVVNLA